MKLLLTLLFAFTFISEAPKKLHGEYCKVGNPNCDTSIDFQTDSTGMLKDSEKGNLWHFRYKVVKGDKVSLYNYHDSTLIGVCTIAKNDSTIIFNKVTYKK